MQNKLRHSTFSFLFLCLALAACISCQSVRLNHAQRSTPFSFKTAGGTSVFFEPIRMGDPSKAHITIWVKGGMAQGVIASDLVNRVWLSGGSAKTSASVIDALAEQGVTIEPDKNPATQSQVVSRTDYLGFKITCPATRAIPILEIFLEILTNPAFPDHKINEAKKLLVAKIQKAHANPYFLPDISGRQLVLGTSDTRSKVINVADSNSVNRDELLAYVSRVSAQSSIVIGLRASSFDKTAVQRIIEGSLVRLPVAARLSTPDISPAAQPGVYFKECPIKDAKLRVLLPSTTTYNDADWPIHLIRGTVLVNGYFAGKLPVILRTTKGWSYNVYFKEGVDWAGTSPEGAYVESPKEHIKELLDITLNEMLAFSSQEIDEETFIQARDTLVNNAPFMFESDPSHRLEAQMQLALQGYPTDFYRHYQKKIRSVTRQQMSSFLKKTWTRPNQFIILVAGPRSLLTQVQQYASKHNLGDVKEMM